MGILQVSPAGAEPIVASDIAVDRLGLLNNVTSERALELNLGRGIDEGSYFGVATIEWPKRDAPHGSTLRNIRDDFHSTAPVPEPATLALAGGGLIAIALRMRRRDARNTPPDDNS